MEKTIEIYQFKEEFFRDYISRPYSEKLNISLDRYEKTYTCKRPHCYSLEDAFGEFNCNHPKDFTGYSLSVGDIVVVTEEIPVLNKQTTTIHYVNTIGFKDITDQFVKGV